MTYSPPLVTAERTFVPSQIVQVSSEAKYSSVPSHVFVNSSVCRVKLLGELNVK